MRELTAPRVDSQVVQEGGRFTSDWSGGISRLFDWILGTWKKYTPSSTATAYAITGAVYRQALGDIWIEFACSFQGNNSVTELTASLPLPALNNQGAFSCIIGEAGQQHAGVAYVGTDGLLHIRRWDNTAFFSGLISLVVTGRYREA